MFEGAADFTVTSEVIVTVENIGTGPERLTRLHFDGYIPRPTPDKLEESGIAAINQPVTYTEPVINPGDTSNIYSITFPFAPGGDVVSCTSDGTDGQFTVILIGNVAGELTERKYNVTYRGQDLTDCQISVERTDS
jgi:hypothetical protein